MPEAYEVLDEKNISKQNKSIRVRQTMLICGMFLGICLSNDFGEKTLGNYLFKSCSDLGKNGSLY